MGELIQADDNNLKPILQAGQPVLLYLHDGETRHKPTTDAAQKLAKKYADRVKVASVNVADNPVTAAKYKDLELPAVVTLEQKVFGLRVKSSAGMVRPTDLRAHLAYLLDEGGLPQAQQATEAKTVVQAAVNHVTDRNFKREVLKSKMPVLVDFWAPWCGPCNQVSPVIEQLGEEYKGQVRVMKLNIDENPKTTRQYNVMSIPTVMIFSGGVKVGSTVGAQPKRSYERMIREALVK